jgi:hypothetical protein
MKRCCLSATEGIPDTVSANNGIPFCKKADMGVVRAIKAWREAAIHYELVECYDEGFEIKELNVSIPRFELAMTYVHVSNHVKARAALAITVRFNGDPANFLCGSDFHIAQRFGSGNRKSGTPKARKNTEPAPLLRVAWSRWLGAFTQLPL